MTLSKLLEGQTAIVTGASRGIGKAIAIFLAKEGAEVIINYSSSLENANKVVSEINSFGGKAYPLQADISNESSVNELIKTVLEKNNKIDVLVNSAGVRLSGGLETTSMNDWSYHFNNNVTGTFLACKYILPLLKKSNKSSIINLASINSIRGVKNMLAYATSKSAIGSWHSLCKQVVGRPNNFSSG